MQQLVKAKLVGSQRGIGGGFHLLKTPGEISILDVVNSVILSNNLLLAHLGLKVTSRFALCITAFPRQRPNWSVLLLNHI